jgi:hypothetical protein
LPHTVTFKEYIASCGDAREKSRMLEFAHECCIRLLEDGQGLGDAVELRGVNH